MINVFFHFTYSTYFSLDIRISKYSGPTLLPFSPDKRKTILNCLCLFYIFHYAAGFKQYLFWESA